MKRRIILFFLFLFLMARTYAASGPRANLTPKDFFEHIQDLSDKALANRQLALSSDIARGKILRSQKEQLWTLTSELTAEQGYDSGIYRDSYLANTLQRKSDSGLTVAVDLEMFVGDRSAEVVNRKSLSYGVKVDQELLHRGDNSTGSLERKSIALNANRDTAQLKSNELENRMNLIDYAAARYVRICDIQDMTELFQRLEKFEKIASVQLQARSIGSRDYSRILALKANLALQITTLKGDLTVVHLSDQTWGNELSTYVQESESQFDCGKTFENLLETAVPTKDELVSLVPRHPDISSLDADLKVMQNMTEIIKVKQAPRLDIFAKMERSHIDSSEGIRNEYRGGLLFEMPLDDDLAKSDTAIIAKSKILNEFQRNRKTIDLTSRIENLFAIRDTSKEQYSSAKNLLSEINKLLSIIETQQDLGMLDATTAVSSFQDRWSVSQKLRQLWMENFTASEKLNLFGKFLKRGKNLTMANSGKEGSL